MADTLLGALAELTSGSHLLYLLLGVCLGFVVGILPGLGGIVGFSIMLPFLYGMEPASALAMLIGLVAVVPTSDTLTSVLMGIPGSSSSQATVVDGFALAKKGEGARALSAAYFSSLVGGLAGAAVLTAFVLVARPVILLMGSAELFMLGLLGVAMVGILCGDSVLKGIIACGLGLVLGAVGGAPATGEWRMSFDSDYLYDGLKLVIVGLAVFAVPEIAELLARGKSIARRELAGRGWLQGMRDTWLHRWIVARCAGIGCLIGALPGLGGSVVDWIAYGHVIQSSRDKSRFGDGDIRGVIAPESANNAKEGGGLIPTLLFGIPGSGSMAVFLGGLTLVGLEPGPAMAGSDIGFTYVIIWSLALANVVGALLCIALSPQMARLTGVRYAVIAPFILAVICFAAFQANKQFYDLAALLALGCFATLMKRGGWPRPALLIGFVLSDTLETYFYQAMQFYGWEFILRPGAMIIFLCALATMAALFRRRDKLRTPKEEEAKQTVWRGNFWMTVGLAAFFAFALADSLQHSLLGAVFPAGAAAISLLCCAAYLWRQRRMTVQRAPVGDGADLPTMMLSMLWLAGLVLLTGLAGFVPAISLLFVLLLRLKAGASWGKTLLLTGGGVGGLVFVAHYARMDFPWGALQYYVELPWPLG